MKKIKISLFVALVTLFAFTSNAQKSKKGKSDELGRIVLNAYVPNQTEGIPSASKKMLANKLGRVASANGVGGSMLNPRFILAPTVTVLTKDLTATAPPMTALTLDVTLYIGDGIDGKLFASESFELKGVGTNETKAYNAALKRLSPKSAAIKDFIESGKMKIIDYYNSNCDLFLSDAKNLEGQNKFDEAILLLSSVPTACGDCYKKTSAAIIPIFKKAINKDCKIKLSKAQGIWAANQSIDAANEAGEILSTVDPDAACFKDVKALHAKIAKRVKELDKREWKYVLNEQDLDRDRIKAARDIGVAYGNGQPKNVTYKSIW